ncbi:hypothetical protein WN943_023467 [Citrus x changshan-huyou]
MNTLSVRPSPAVVQRQSLTWCGGGATARFERIHVQISFFHLAIVLGMRKKMIAARTVSYFLFFPNVSLFQLLVIQGKPELVADDETKMAQMTLENLEDCDVTEEHEDGVIAEDAEASVAIVAAIVKLRLVAAL